MLRTLLTIILLQVIASSSNAQIHFERTFDIIVENGNDPLKRAWEGGMNNIFINECYFDSNPEKDLMIFDKGNKNLFVLLNNAQTFQSIDLGVKIDKWLLLRDFNCDGKLDIFTGTTGGIRVYEQNSNWNFSLKTLTIQSKSSTGTSNLYSANTDVPAIEDFDGDGDLDIISFAVNGEFIEFHKNFSKERTTNCDLDFELNSNCWGGFKEDASSNSIVLNQSCAAVPSARTRSGGQHAGSTITAVNFNKDDLIDILVGDISDNSMVHLKNGGTNLSANINQLDNNFPNYDSPVNINLFPYASYVDVNHDDKKDLIISSTDIQAGDNKKTLYYENIGSNEDTFALSSSEFLVGEMIDVGSKSIPVPCDENQDGLIDLLIGGSGEIIDGVHKGKIALYRNTGSLSTPKYELIDDDYLNFSQNQETFLSPAIGDIDQDGDDDLIIGLENGKLLYYQNQAGNGNAYNFVLANANFESIDVGNFATPQIVDINNDLLPDLLIGTQEGNIYYYPNQITGNSGYDFSQEIQNFGNISMKDFSNGIFFGYATPWAVKVSGDYFLYVGGEAGKIHVYEIDESNPNSTFTAITTNLQDIYTGTHSCPRIVELGNLSTHPEMLLGNQSGGLAFYDGFPPEHSSTIRNTSINYTIENNELIVHELKTNEVLLYSVTGQLLQVTHKNKITLPLTSGTYILVVKGVDFIGTEKVMIVR